MSGPRLKSAFGRLVSPIPGARQSGILSSSYRPAFSSSIFPSLLQSPTSPITAAAAAFSTSNRPQNWLIPRVMSTKRSPKGRPRVSTGGSMRGTTVAWGDYGLRMVDRHRRITSTHLRLAVEALKSRFRGMEYQLFTRVAANISVAVSGNEVRMGKGKGSHDHWVAKVTVSQIVLEVKTNIHEQVVKDAFRVVGSKLPGQYEMARKGDPPYMGLVPVTGVNTVESLMNPRKSVIGDGVAKRLAAISASSSPSFSSPSSVSDPLPSSSLPSSAPDAPPAA